MIILRLQISDVYKTIMIDNNLIEISVMICIYIMIEDKVI